MSKIKQRRLAYVYIIQSEAGSVQIGVSTSPEKRFKAIEESGVTRITKSFISHICYNHVEVVKWILSQFSPMRKDREWYDDIDFDTIKRLVEARFNAIDLQFNIPGQSSIGTAVNPLHDRNDASNAASLMSLVPVSQSQIGNDTVNAVNARELHQWLDVQTQFSKWIERRIEEYGFIDGQDFQSNLAKSIGGRPSTDYLISLDMAKELSMVERTAKGKEARQYFIACEKMLRGKFGVNPPHSNPTNEKLTQEMLIEIKNIIDQVATIAAEKTIERTAAAFERITQASVSARLKGGKFIRYGKIDNPDSTTLPDSVDEAFSKFRDILVNKETIPEIKASGKVIINKMLVAWAGKLSVTGEYGLFVVIHNHYLSYIMPNNFLVNYGKSWVKSGYIRSLHKEKIYAQRRRKQGEVSQNVIFMPVNFESLTDKCNS